MVNNFNCRGFGPLLEDKLCLIFKLAPSVCRMTFPILASLLVRLVVLLPDKLVLTSVTPASSAPVLQTPKATSSTLYFDSLTVNAGNGGFLHCIQMDTSVNAANQVVSVGADIAFDADPKFF